MERKARGVKEDGAAYNCLFDPASGINESIKKSAVLDDTVAMLPEKVKEYKHQAQRIAIALCDIDKKVSKTCYNIWKFLTNNIAYQPDQKGKEQVRSVRRLWSDRIGDCDCFSFFTSCVLSVLRIPHSFRIASYDQVSGSFGHVYIVVPDNGKEIIIDAVLPEFNREHPYVKIKDKEMDLEFLDGIDPELFSRNGGMSIDAEDLLSYQLPSNDESVGALKDFFNRTKEKIQSVKQDIKKDVKKVEQNIKTDVKKVGKGISKGIHVINRINPVTTALRLGLLAGMKLNLFGVAGQLRYAYLPDADAQKRGVNMARFDRFKKVRTKLEKIFFNAGGKPENLKEAILSGKGNQDKAVALSGYALSGLGFTNESPIEKIIGTQLYADETPPESLDGLGVVATAAVTAAASGILATIAGIIKNIGKLFEKGDPGSDKGLDALDQQAGDGSTTDESAPDANSDENNSTTRQGDAGSSTDATSTDNTTTDNTSTDNSGGDPAPTPSTFDKVKDWVVTNKTPLIITASALAVGVTGFILYRKYAGKKKTKSEGNRASEMKGVPHSAHQKKSVKGRKSNESILRDLRLSRMK